MINTHRTNNPQYALAIIINQSKAEFFIEKKKQKKQPSSPAPLKKSLGDFKRHLGNTLTTNHWLYMMGWDYKTDTRKAIFHII